jgi:hypothetical protein
MVSTMHVCNCLGEAIDEEKMMRHNTVCKYGFVCDDVHIKTVCAAMVSLMIGALQKYSCWGVTVQLSRCLGFFSYFMLAVCILDVSTSS